MAIEFNFRATFRPDMGVWVVVLQNYVMEVSVRGFTEMVNQMKKVTVPEKMADLSFIVPADKPFHVDLKQCSRATWLCVRDYLAECEDSFQAWRRKRPRDGQNKTSSQ